MQRFVFGCAVFALCASVVLSVAHSVYAQDISSTNYQILTPAVSAGGGYATSDNFSLLGVISGFSQARSSATSYNLAPGFAAYPFVSTPVITATAGDASASLSWTAATGVLGYTVSSYSVGQTTASGGPYTFTAVGNVLSYTASSLTNGTTYYFILRVLDPQGLTIATSSEVSATPAAAAPAAAVASGGGGGGGGSIATPAGATVHFRGRAYPNSTVVLLKDGQIALSSVAGGDARFDFSLTDVSAGSYMFLVYGIDSAGNKSLPLSFPATLSLGATTNVSGIFIGPTIDVDKAEVRRGDNISIFGQTSASSTVTIAVHSDTEHFMTTTSDETGAYLYMFDTAPLEFGSHLAKSKAATAGQISNFSASVGFAVGDQTVEKTLKPTCARTGDLNCESRVNLVDFSIMAFWYARPLTPLGAKADLNNDGKVNLVDFSILAAHWTG